MNYAGSKRQSDFCDVLGYNCTNYCIPRSGKCAFTLSQTSLQKGDGGFHKWRKTRKLDCFVQEQHGLGGPPSPGPSECGLSSPAHVHQEAPGVQSSWEIRPCAFPQRWPFISCDTRWLRGLEKGYGISSLRLSQSLSITPTPNNMG